jgi:DNA topoisomerase-3
MDDKNCKCGAPSKRYEVKKEGPNQGRAFYACAKFSSDPKKCDFWEWEKREPEINGKTQDTGTTILMDKLEEINKKIDKIMTILP